MDVSLSTMRVFAKDFVADLPREKGERAHMVGLSGELGAGKTTFVQAVAHELGIQIPVVSPTFALVQVYPIDHPPFKCFIHIDAYRLEKKERDTIGWSAYMRDPENLILVEWPERIPGGFLKNLPLLSFNLRGEDIRAITYGKS